MIPVFQINSWSFKVHTAIVVARDIADVKINYTLPQRSVLDKQYMICPENVLGVNIRCKQCYLANRAQWCMVCLGLYCACLLVAQFVPENPTSQIQTLAFFNCGSQYPLLLQLGQRFAFVQPSAEFTIFSGSLRSYIFLLFEIFRMQPVKPV